MFDSQKDMRRYYRDASRTIVAVRGYLHEVDSRVNRAVDHTLGGVKRLARAVAATMQHSAEPHLTPAESLVICEAAKFNDTLIRAIGQEVGRVSRQISIAVTGLPVNEYNEIFMPRVLTTNVREDFLRQSDHLKELFDNFKLTVAENTGDYLSARKVVFVAEGLRRNIWGTVRALSGEVGYQGGRAYDNNCELLTEHVDQLLGVSPLEFHSGQVGWCSRPVVIGGHKYSPTL